MKKIYILIIFLSLTSGLQAREFLNTVVHLNFGGMYTFASDGNIIREEKSAINSNFTSGSPKTSHYSTAYSLTLDIVPMKPVLIGLEDAAVKFGVRGSYKLNFLQQRVKSEGQEYGDKVMDYTSWMVGPVIHYAPFIEPSSLDYEYTASGGFTLFALFGKLNGDLTAYPAVREAVGSPGNYSTKISGYKMDIGVGAEIALCAVNFGVNIYYSRTTIELKEAVYSGMGRRGRMHEGCMEIYIGIPIEPFIKPIIPRF